jgi:hypothetical protein
MSNIYLASPLYDGTLYWRSARALWQAAQQHNVTVVHSEMSLIPYNCNQHWCNVLNGRKKLGFKWFAMLHSDVGPEPFWLDKIVAEAEKYGADMLSAVVPIKTDAGLTSTAILRSQEPASRRLHRLTTSQCFHPSFPDTLGINEAVDALEKLPPDLRETALPREALLVNTGCMIVRCDQPWAERVWFDDPNGIELVDGDWVPTCTSEDWHFSHRVAQEGGKVMATRVVSLVHRGVADYPSGKVWGRPRE